jgi:HK97 family phage prohead protease
MAQSTAQTVCMKMADLRVKAAGPEDGLAEGEFIAYASVFGNVDSYGDIVDDTAFDRTLAEWQEKGDTIPVLWGHDMWDPFNNIGGVKEATIVKMDSEEKADGDKPGLKVHAALDLENPTAAQVYRLVKGRRTTKMSFAYAVRDQQDAEDGNHLKDVDLFEVSVVQVPANEEAEILAVKSAAGRLIKAGRVLSAKNETALREARDAISSVLDALDSQSGSGEEEDGKAAAAAGTQQPAASEKTAAKPGASDEDPSGDKSSVPGEEPKSGSSVDDALEMEFLLTAATIAGKD